MFKLKICNNFRSKSYLLKVHKSQTFVICDPYPLQSNHIKEKGCVCSQLQINVPTCLAVTLPLSYSHIVIEIVEHPDNEDKGPGMF